MTLGMGDDDDDGGGGGGGVGKSGVDDGYDSIIPDMAGGVGVVCRHVSGTRGSHQKRENVVRRVFRVNENEILYVLFVDNRRLMSERWLVEEFRGIPGLSRAGKNLY